MYFLLLDCVNEQVVNNCESGFVTKTYRLILVDINSYVYYM